MYALRLLTFLRPYKKRTALTFLAVLGASAFVLAIPQLIRWAINFGLGAKVEGGHLVTDGNTQTLIIASLAVVGAAALRGVFTFLQTYLGEWISQRVAYDVRNRIYDRLQRLSYAYHDRQQTGQLMSRATQDVEAVRWFIHMGVLRFGYILLLLSAILVLMAVTNWKLTLVVWAFLPFIAWRSTVMALSLRPLWMKIQEGLARLTTVLQEALTGARVVKAFARERYEGEKFRREAEALFADSYRSGRIQAFNSPMMTGFWLAAIAATLWFGGREVINGNLNIGELAAFLLYLAILNMPVRKIGRAHV